MRGGSLPASVSNNSPTFGLLGSGPVVTTIIKYYYINSQRVAQAKDGVFTWIHADHLSSATRITDVNGLEVRRLAYKSFGEETENQGAGDDPKYKYTGKEIDTSGLYYYYYYYYYPALSRFITADTIYDAGPQGLNRYSYALNNPIIYHDPTGHFVSGPDDDPNPTGDGCITGPPDNGGEGMVYHENHNDPSNIHYNSPHRFYKKWPHKIYPMHRGGPIIPYSHRGVELWADDSSPISKWLAKKIGDILGTFSPGEKINPFTKMPVPYSVREEVIVTSATLAASGVAKLAGVPVTASGVGDDLAGVGDDLASQSGIPDHMRAGQVHEAERLVVLE